MRIGEIIDICKNTPWKLFNEINRILLFPFIWLIFRANGIKWGKGWKIYGLPIIQVYRGSKVIIGDYLELRSSQGSNPLSPYHPVVISTRSSQAQLIIGDHFSMTGGSLVAENNITIGDNVMIGANSTIIDTDFHQLVKSKLISKPISIENGVFIGTLSVILKGTTLGKNSIVGAGSVVGGKFNSQSILFGNRAKVVQRKIK